MSNYIFPSIKLSDEPVEGYSEVQLMRTGEFGYGKEKLDITPNDFSSMVKNFNEVTKGNELAFDFDHRSFDEAAGWIKDLYTKENDSQLWAKVEWSDIGKQKLEGKRYKYTSAEFSFDYQDNEEDKKHGPTLLGAALTNRPFLKKMNAVTLSDKYEVKMTKQTDIDINELKVSADAIMDENKKLSERNAEIQKQLSDIKKENETLKKEREFETHLSKGLVCEAQRTAFMDGDMETFIKNQFSMNLKKTSSSEEPKKEEKSAQVQVLDLTKARMQKEQITFSQALNRVKDEQPELFKKYRQEVEI